MDLTDIYEPIKEDIEKVKKELKNQLNGDNRYVVPLKNHVLKSRGKLIRPALLLLSVKGVEPTTQKLSNSTRNHLLPAVSSSRIPIASAIELVHTASLLHDDVLDEEKIRRRQPTVNNKWGNKIAILFGDYLYSLATSIVIDYQKIAMILSDVVSKMSEGELIHNLKKDDLNTTEEEYIQIITKKSALLFGASCRIGAMLAIASSEQQESLSQYGINFGIAYQILDDLLDIESDLILGKITLPLIYLQNSYDGLLLHTSRIDIKEVVDRVCRKICEYLDKAKKSLKIIPNSTYKLSLERLLQKFKAVAENNPDFFRDYAEKIYSCGFPKILNSTVNNF